MKETGAQSGDETGSGPQPDGAPAHSLVLRLIWLTVGLLSVPLAIAGFILPLVPGVPFLLLAAFAFARSSPRLHDWLVSHPRFGPLIDNWRTHGGIPRPAKITAVATMAAAVVIAWALGAPRSVLIVQAAVLSALAVFIATRPAGPR